MRYIFEEWVTFQGTRYLRSSNPGLSELINRHPEEPVETWHKVLDMPIGAARVLNDKTYIRRIA